MILIIGDDKETLDNLESEIKNGNVSEISSLEEIIGIVEVGRCITPIDPLKRRFIEEESRRGFLLAKNAQRVYLFRNKFLRRIK